MAPTPSLSSPTAAAAAASSSPLELRHVLLFHRHGDRTPVLLSAEAASADRGFWASRVASDAQLARLARVGHVVGRSEAQEPTISPVRGDSWPCGALTSLGVAHMTRKGRSLRAKYGALLDTQQDTNKQIYVLTSSVPRCIQSVQCLLDGLLHEEDEDEDAVAPVLVHTFEKNVLAPQHPLKVFFQIERIVADDIAQLPEEDREAMQTLGEQLRELLRVPADRPLAWTAVRDDLKCREAHGLPLPDGISPAMAAKVYEYDAWMWHKLYSRHDFCLDAFQDGVREVYEHLGRVVNASEDDRQPKIAFFSAHDNSIVALVCSLGLQIGGQLPEYGTVVAFEVYRDPNTRQHFIKATFDGTEVAFAGHEHDVLCPFEHIEKRALAFLEETSA